MREVSNHAVSRDDLSATDYCEYDYYEYALPTLKEAAGVLDLTEQAVRKRVARATLPETKLYRTRYVRLAIV